MYKPSFPLLLGGGVDPTNHPFFKRKHTHFEISGDFGSLIHLGFVFVGDFEGFHPPSPAESNDDFLFQGGSGRWEQCIPTTQGCFAPQPLLDHGDSHQDYTHRLKKACLQDNAEGAWTKLWCGRA